MDGNAVVAAERAHARLGPAVAAPGRFARAIEQPRNLPVRHQPRQLADQRQCILGYRPAVLADSIPLHFQRSVVAALPMQDHLDILGLNAHDDFAQSRTQDSLACRRRCRRMRPSACEVGAELHELLPLHLSQGHWLPCLESSDLAFDPVHDLQRLVPAPLELTGNQTIGGIDSIVLPARMRGLEACPLQRQLPLPLGGRRLAGLGIERLDRRFDAEWLQNPQHLRANGVIDAHAAERDAALGAVVDESTLAKITPCLAAIGHIHFTTAVATTQKAGEEQFPTPHSSSGDGASLAGRIVGNHLLVPLELHPGDIAVVLILEQHSPLGQWPAHATLDPLTALLDANLARCSPEGIRSTIDGVGQDIVNGVVEWQPPDNAAPLRGTVACGGQCDAFPAQPHMHLSHALKLGELGEYDSEGSLHLLVRVLLDSIALSLHIAGCDTEKQRTAPRFLLQCLLRALTKQRQFQLAHCSLHAEQQAVIGVSRIIDSVLVYDDGPDQSTELDQRVPVATVAGEAGGFDGEYGADACLADRRQQTLEARPSDAAARAAEIIIDNLNGGPSELFGAIGEPILAPLALPVVHELIRRRLADVDEGSAREMVSGDLGHRRPPRPPAPRRSRAAELPPKPLTAPSVRESATSDSRPRRTGLAVESRPSASCLAPSIPESDWRSASTSARRVRKTSREKRG